MKMKFNIFLIIIKFVTITNSWNIYTHNLLTNKCLSKIDNMYYYEDIILNGLQIYDDNIYDTSRHYYNPITKNNNIEIKNPTAFTQFIYHFTQSQKYKNDNDIPKSSYELGQALHYFEDIHVPYHVSQMWQIHKHKAFENHAYLIYNNINFDKYDHYNNKFNKIDIINNNITIDKYFDHCAFQTLYLFEKKIIDPQIYLQNCYNNLFTLFNLL